jgi:hypothetical protein
MLAAIPTQYVATGHRKNCIVSYIARPALTEPPGELIAQKQQLRDDKIGGGIIDRPAKKDYPVLEQP